MNPEYIYIESYGCSANMNNAEIIKGLATQAGLEIVSNPKIADILVINTCIVKSPTENKIKARIEELKKLNKPIIIAGCMPDVRAKELKDKNIYLLSNKNIKQINNLIKSIPSLYNQDKFLTKNDEIKLNLPKINENKKIGVTQISEGCLGSCSFCLTRHAKGKLFSYPEEKILENIKADLSSGCKEVWITSQDCASYGLDKDKANLPKLLKKIIQLESNFKIRLGMMNPNNVLPILNELIDIYKNEKIYKYIHIPVQSASNKILKNMNRQYKAEDFVKIIREFRKEIPDIVIATDIILAYPEETEQDFKETIELIKKIKPEQLNVSKFWAIRGTEASLLAQVSSAISKSRAEKVMLVFNELIKEKNKELEGRIFSCLVYDSFNSNFLARTPSYKLVTLKSEKNILGKIVQVKIIRTERNHLVGEIVR